VDRPKIERFNWSRDTALNRASIQLQPPHQESTRSRLSASRIFARKGIRHRRGPPGPGQAVAPPKGRGEVAEAGSSAGTTCCAALHYHLAPRPSSASVRPVAHSKVSKANCVLGFVAADRRRSPTHAKTEGRIADEMGNLFCADHKQRVAAEKAVSLAEF